MWALFERLHARATFPSSRLCCSIGQTLVTSPSRIFRVSYSYLSLASTVDRYVPEQPISCVTAGSREHLQDFEVLYSWEKRTRRSFAQRCELAGFIPLWLTVSFVDISWAHCFLWGLSMNEDIQVLKSIYTKTGKRSQTELGAQTCFIISTSNYYLS